MTAKFLGDDRLGPDIRRNIRVVVERGTPEALLGEFVDDANIALTVIGSRGRGRLFDAVIGSTAKRLVESLEGDLLIVSAGREDRQRGCG